MNFALALAANRLPGITVTWIAASRLGRPLDRNRANSSSQKKLASSPSFVAGGVKRLNPHRRLAAIPGAIRAKQQPAQRTGRRFLSAQFSQHDA